MGEKKTELDEFAKECKQQALDSRTHRVEEIQAQVARLEQRVVRRLNDLRRAPRR